MFRHSGLAGLALLATLGSFAATAAAQPPSTEFQQLPNRVRVGETIWVTGEDGVQREGRLWRLSPSSLELMSKGQAKAFDAESVRAISARKPESLANGALIGLGVGIALSALGAVACEDDYLECFALGSLVYGGAGAGIGVGIDALTPPGKQEVYRRQPIASSRVSVKPLVSGRAQGLVVRIAF